MPLQIIWEAKGVVRRFSDVVTNADVLASVHRVHSSPRFDQLRYSLNDFSAVTGLNVRREAEESVAIQAMGASYTNKDLIMAFVASDPEVDARLRIFLDPMFASYPAAYFSDEAAARAWISAQTGQANP